MSSKRTTGRTRGTRSTQSKGQNKAPTLRHGTRHEQEEHEAHTPPRWSLGSRPGRMVHRRRRPEGLADAKAVERGAHDDGRADSITVAVTLASWALVAWRHGIDVWER
jgi:hypothetical protein